MTIKRIAAALVVTAALLFGVSNADAARPLDVDCDLLEATNIDVNVFLEANNVTFDNLGDVVASAILDDAIFQQLGALILFFSGGAIEFDSASQLVSTNGRCGRLPNMVGNTMN